VKVRVIVEVVDEKTKRGVRRRRTIKPNERALKSFRALCESTDELITMIADDVAVRAVESIERPESTMNAATFGALDEVSGPSERQQSPVAQKQTKKVDDFLRLDLIEHMDGLDNMSQLRAQQMVAPQHAESPQPPAQPTGPGPIGFDPEF